MSEITLFYLKFVLLAGVYALLGLLIRALVRDLPMPAKPAGEPMPQAQDAPGWWLAVLQGRERLEGRSLRLQDELLLGRSPECQVQVNDPFASARHARLVPRGEGVWLEDLGSTNGSAVDRQPCPAHEAVPVPFGGAIQLGGMSFRLEE